MAELFMSLDPVGEESIYALFCLQCTASLADIMESDNMFLCWFSNNIYLVFHCDCQSRRYEFCVIKRRKLLFQKAKSLQPALDFLLTFGVNFARLVRSFIKMNSVASGTNMSMLAECLASFFLPHNCEQQWLFWKYSLLSHCQIIIQLWWSKQNKFSLQKNSLPLFRFL